MERPSASPTRRNGNGDILQTVPQEAKEKLTEMYYNCISGTGQQFIDREVLNSARFRTRRNAEAHLDVVSVVPNIVPNGLQNGHNSQCVY